MGKGGGVRGGIYRRKLEYFSEVSWKQSIEEGPHIIGALVLPYKRRVESAVFSPHRLEKLTLLWNIKGNVK